ncbi:MAG: 2-amino-4-hydroxy-6-hydroxymethyldihydropteridine diphosphokinase [Gammaproteobacteria bacterium]|nr:2-amino-4-hydroxy-6-hydroxymethyldihydropteridine diphosphokinase [Gammaproteobacteria bacterium]MCP5458027.1 2-amino-4-hydroxy-6-hydroxymethyldihydropteridine diphosphokinase [Gammaproteobacteria bacterium]
MAKVYVSIGSNRDRERNICSCLRHLREVFGELQVSTVYRSASIGFQGADFLNLVVGFDTAWDVWTVATLMRRIETAHGRRRGQHRFTSRTLDLDVLLYDDLVLQDDALHVPRDDITRYAFVLCPLAELAGECRHPLLAVTFAELWRAFPVDERPPLQAVELDCSNEESERRAS